MVSAARASVTQRYHVPVWRNSQLLLKRSYTSLLSGMQYFAPLTMKSQLQAEEPKTPLWKSFQWLSREIIEEKTTQPHDKVNKYTRSGEAVGGIVNSKFIL